MKKIFILFVFLIFSFPVLAKVNSKDINFPGKFYTDKIESCETMEDITMSSRLFSDIFRVKGFVGYDWHSDHQKNSTSLTVKHENITEPIKILMLLAHNALSNKDQYNIKEAKDLLIEIAKADTLYNSIGPKGLKDKPKCWKNGNVNAPCWYHEYEFAKGVFGNYMITAIWLKSELDEKEFTIVNSYIKKMYKKFLKPKEFEPSDRGFYQMANAGISTLVYASWTDDKKLAAKEINFRFKEIDSLFYDDGYINNNSFRGVRAQWYHSYGLNPALAYVYIADLWGAKVPDAIIKKLTNASLVVNLAIKDYDTFRAREFTGEYNENISEDPKHARKHTHQDSIGIDKLMKLVTGVTLENDPIYLEKRNITEIDDTIGFNPHCL